ncbi:hypothetical protein FHX59_005475 [Paraburkholderia silvatlantica]|uniref:Lipoprotein n=2 Tax=Paraburkholderia silvatlantica TaxID=321895 RepID=A0ABR6FU98_9BURK|nr:hypothetical protein [Paraburkholderia silvatlantica]MBB2931008.1 hypothetical protein [Paraburkholderia silvatlantica]PVY26955.1 hypothetical protein C7411_1213 [Paraburkholderia silvatlantica]PXW33231.1 hypothetical protein C7413_1203 [Paraburkholderia silvatlantica]
MNGMNARAKRARHAGTDSPASRPARLIALAALCAGIALAASGCSSIGAASGAAAAAATGIVTANPAVGIGVGIAVQAATDEAVGRFMKSMHADQQAMIARTAGRLPVGGMDIWRIKHDLPVENGHGQVRVTRAFANALTLCKDFVFSVQDGEKADAPEQWFAASACQDQSGWKWATAEPAVERWGTLQ